MRGANCWTDHYLVRARLRVMLPQTAVAVKCPLPFAVHKLAKPELHDSYVRSLEQRLSGWSLFPESTAEEDWNHLQSCVTIVPLKSLLEEEFTLTQSSSRRIPTC